MRFATGFSLRLRHRTYIIPFIVKAWTEGIYVSVEKNKLSSFSVERNVKCEQDRH